MSVEQLRFDYAESRLKQAVASSKEGDILSITREDAVIILDYITWLFRENSEMTDEILSLEDDLQELRR